MLASTSRPMSPEVVSRNTSRVRAVGGSPVRAERAARSERKQHLRRLDSSAAAVAAVVVAARRRRSTSTSAVRASPASGDDGAPSSSTNQNRKRVVILGGTGRVGASTAAQLVRGPGGSQLDLVLVGKPEATPPSSSSPSSPPSAAVSAACRKVPALSKAIVQVAAVDSGDVEGLAGLLEGAACVVHCAGPFQSGGAGAGAGAGAEGGGRGGEKGGSIPAPLAAAIRAKVPYVDVCDDPDWAKLALSADAEARSAGVPAITTAGVFPGLSGLMASHMCAVARLESAPLGIKVAPRDDEEAASGGGPPALAAARAKAAAASSSSNSKPSSPAPSATVTTVTPTSIPEGAAPSEPSRLRYSYYVAGSGGAGPAVLAATLLLAGRDAAAWKDGSKLTRPAFSEPLPADFGRFIGRKTVYLIDLPEVEAAAVDLRVPSVSARFATAPGIFNLGTVLLARLLPKSVLGDRGFASSAAGVLGPLVAAADAAMKALPVAIRVDLELKKKTERDDGRDGDGGGATSTSMATTTGTKSGSELRAPRRERRRDDPFLRGDDEQASSSAFVHRDMATAVGACTAAFARELLFGGGARADKNEKLSVPVGVCRPEALPAESRERILRDVAENSGAARFEVGAPPWALDSEPTRLGFGMYW